MNKQLVDFTLLLGVTVLAADEVVDFRYSPPEWQAAICFPDDPQKTLVDKTGDLLYNYGRGGR